MQLNEAGPVTLALAAFLKEMHIVGKSGAVNPGHLFGQVCRRSPQFRGFQQQDAHELLRHLLDSLRSEEVKRQKTAILRVFGLSEKTDPKTVSQKVKRKLQALGRYSNFTLIDKIFGGQLVSTIVCEQCHNSSQIYEPFLDLSLPLVEEKPQRPGKNNFTNKFDEEDEENNPPVSCFGGFRKRKDAADEEDSKSNKKMSKNERKRVKAQSRKTKKLAQKQANIIDLNEKPEGSEEKQEKDQLESEKSCEKPEIKKEEEESSGVEKTVESTDLTRNLNNDKKPNIGNRFEALQVAKSSQKTPLQRNLGGSEEDDEDGFTEEDGDWEWDYDEEQEDKSKESGKCIHGIIYVRPYTKNAYELG